MARPIHWTHETALDAIRRFVVEHDRLPSHEDYRNPAHGLPSSSTVYKVCGDFYHCLTLEGFDLPAPVKHATANHFWRRQTFGRGSRASY